jgi:hypothetical protein
MVAIQHALDHFLKEGAKTHKIAAKIARLADREGMHPQDVIRFPDLLEDVGLEPDDVSEMTAHHAAGILRNHDEFLRQWVKEWNGPEQTQTPSYENRTSLPEPPKRKKLWGFAVTAVIRWMGVEGFSTQEASRALKKLGYDIAETTIMIQLLAGKRGDMTRGEPANLSAQQANTLCDLTVD